MKPSSRDFNPCRPSRPVLTVWMVLCLVGLSCLSRSAPATANAPNLSASPADERQRVVVVATRDEQGLLPLLRAELQDLGLRVVEQSMAQERGNPKELSQSALLQDAVAAFRIVVHERSVEVWIFDRATNEVTLREVFAQADGSPVEARTAVLHAVELLRWSLRENERRAKPSSAVPVAPAPAPPAPPTILPREWFVTLTPLVLYSPGGTRPGAGAALDVTWQPQRFGARLLAASLVLPNELAQPEGKIKVTPGYLALEGIVSAKSPLSRFGYDLGVGLSVLSIRLSGTTELSYQTHEDHLLTLAPLLDLRARYALGDSISLGLGASAMVPFRTDVIRVDEREVGRYGRLLVTVGVGLSAALR